jgi:putative glutamine amidotransferase
VVPVIAVLGRRTPEAKGMRTEAVAAGEHYLDSVRRAGGEPVIIGPTDDRDRLTAVLSRLDGVLMLGGGDVDPAAYGADTIDATVKGVDPRQDTFEMAALDVALELDLPVLAICRGTQVLNVARGGSLHQHIEDHRFVLHPVTVRSGTRLAELGLQRPVGHSVHHQAIDRLGAGLVITATADDGTIEGVELPGRWVIGVQWHPEDTAADDPDQQRLFDALVAAARRAAVTSA